jgi:DNA invertase Pin-like site-specific DNA recombinase
MYYGYIRVSTDYQAKNGVSLEVQKNMIENQFYLNDIPKTEYEVLADEGKSGRSTNGRDHYEALKEEIKGGDVKGVFIYALSRLNRNLKETLEFVELCNKHNTRLVSLYERYDSEVPASKMILYVFSGLAEQQSDEQSVRIKNSLNKKKLEAKKYCKNTPIGYKLEDGALVENKEELKLISRIKNLRSRGHSCRVIAERFNKEGMTTKQGKPWSYYSVYHYEKAYQEEIGEYAEAS